MATRILAVSTVLLAALFLHQYTETATLRAQVAGVEARAASDARAAVLASIGDLGPEIEQTMSWLDGFYRSKDGLARPDGLWIQGHPDYAGIRVWVFDWYVRNRLAGKTPEQARQTIVDAIQQSEEWRAKHRK